jgi:1-acyl-sn-glycerol-3-phosphate acyltransferase
MTDAKKPLTPSSPKRPSGRAQRPLPAPSEVADVLPSPASEATPKPSTARTKLPNARAKKPSVVQQREAELRAASRPVSWIKQREAELAEAARLEEEEQERLRVEQEARALQETAEPVALDEVVDDAQYAEVFIEPVRPAVTEAHPSEARLDELLDEAARAARDPNSRKHVAAAFAKIAQHLGSTEVMDHVEDASLLQTARELLSPEYYVRQWGRVALRDRSEDVDDFGLDKAYEQRMRPLLEALHRRWFRVTTRDIENVPSEGRALLVGNHAGALPWDGLMLKTTLQLEHPAHRRLRWLSEDFVAHTPFLGALTTRLGAVRACPENGERLLNDDKLVAVFPEGEKGVGKPWSQRYEIQRFGRGGFIKLALRTRTPIVPVAVVGSEETHPMLFRSDRWARWLGVPFMPVTPTFPWLGPLGLVPLPSRWVIRFGKPIDLSSEPASAAQDSVRVQHLAEEVRSAVQALVKQALRERTNAF